MADTNAAILAAREKLKEKFAGKAGANIGGKGTTRRKVKAKHANAGPDDKKLQAQLKRLGCNSIPGIEEINMFTANNEVIHFQNPKLQANIAGNTYLIAGPNERKPLAEMPQSIASQMGGGGFSEENMKELLKFVQSKKAEVKPEGDDDIPDVDADFEAVSKENGEKDTTDEVD